MNQQHIAHWHCRGPIKQVRTKPYGCFFMKNRSSSCPVCHFGCVPCEGDCEDLRKKIGVVIQQTPDAPEYSATGGTPEGYERIECFKCGSLVGDINTHDTFHATESLDWIPDTPQELFGDQ